MKLRQLFESTLSVVIPDVGLFRGLVKPFGENEILREVRIRSDRRPLDSTQVGTSVFNKLFEHVHKIPNVRASSMFCTPTASYADTYASGPNALGLVLLPPKAILIINPAVSDSLQLTTWCAELAESYELDPLYDEHPIDFSTCTPQELLSAFEQLSSLEPGSFGVKFKNVMAAVESYQILSTSDTLVGRVDGAHNIEVMVTNTPTCTLVNAKAFNPDRPYELQWDANIRQTVTKFLETHNVTIATR